MLRGVNLRMQQNEFLFKETIIRTRFWALLLNVVQYAAKRSAFWC